MIWIITSNSKSLSDTTSYFIFTRKETVIPHTNKYQFIFNIFSSNNTLNHYENDEHNKFSYHLTEKSQNNSSTIKAVAQGLVEKINESLKHDSDFLEDLIILVACDPSINKSVTQKIEQELSKIRSQYNIKQSIPVNDIYQFLKIVRKDRLVETLKQILNVSSINTDDPYIFGYSLAECLDRK